MNTDEVSTFYESRNISGLLRVVVTQEGFCSAPSIFNADTNSQPLYWKVTKPTLSPSYLQGQSPVWLPRKNGRPPTQNGLTLKEVRQINYLSQVINETLRLVTFSFVVYREAKTDVNISGYMVPKGWKVMIWFRSVHLDPEIIPTQRSLILPDGMFEQFDFKCPLMYLPHPRPKDYCLGRIRRVSSKTV